MREVEARGRPLRRLRAADLRGRCVWRHEVDGCACAVSASKRELDARRGCAQRKGEGIRTGGGHAISRNTRGRVRGMWAWSVRMGDASVEASARGARCVEADMRGGGCARHIQWTCAVDVGAVDPRGGRVRGGRTRRPCAAYARGAHRQWQTAAAALLHLRVRRQAAVQRAEPDARVGARGEDGRGGAAAGVRLRMVVFAAVVEVVRREGGAEGRGVCARGPGAAYAQGGPCAEAQRGVCARGTCAADARGGRARRTHKADVRGGRTRRACAAYAQGARARRTREADVRGGCTRRACAVYAPGGCARCMHEGAVRDVCARGPCAEAQRGVWARGTQGDVRGGRAQGTHEAEVRGGRTRRRCAANERGGPCAADARGEGARRTNEGPCAADARGGRARCMRKEAMRGGAAGSMRQGGVRGGCTRRTNEADVRGGRTRRTCAVDVRGGRARRTCEGDMCGARRRRRRGCAWRIRKGDGGMGAAHARSGRAPVAVQFCLRG
ncbi:hypothetical protein C8F04DRAFT_1176586 [Mycena alexandri]|uniref:Uncharacterized protein n=1 Tax=Mycena alexandri TaxID=1745969 RepID=A0AAD6TAB5_9AGAR|nr:hypothetical protein C8F04DRAFT_1176586 [Mycena alexandri]